MDTSIQKQLVDKMYEKRKGAALELEKQIRECHAQGDKQKITTIIEQLVEMFSNPTNPLQARNGGLIGLAGTAIALSVDVAPYMEKFVLPLLQCFCDQESRVRYFSAECLYNIAKVSKGEILVYFNEIFDSLSKLAADPELSVKNGADLLDRLLKDVVAETASVYVPQYPETEKIRRVSDEKDLARGVFIAHPDDVATGRDLHSARKAFSLPHFLPLLKERIGVDSPFTRSYLVSWITVLDSVPELELITYLPEFFEELLRYLSDPTDDVRIATENLIAEFLREITVVTRFQARHEEELRKKREEENADLTRRTEGDKEKLPDITMSHTEKASFIHEPESYDSPFDDQYTPPDEIELEYEDRDLGAWEPGQGVKIEYAAIVEILIRQLDDNHDVIQQSTAFTWLSRFLEIVQDVMVPFTPRLILAILPNLAHHVPMINHSAKETNRLLQEVILAIPPPTETSGRQSSDKTSSSTPSLIAGSPTPAPNSTLPPRQGTSKEPSLFDHPSDSTIHPSNQSDRSSLIQTPRHRPSLALDGGRANTMTQATQVTAELTHQGSRPDSPASASAISVPQVQQSPEASMLHEKDVFDYKATVDALTIQFLSEHEETRVAALKWLIMLHQKAPKKILAMDDGTFGALLKTLSDSSEEVIKHDLELLAQISLRSEEGYFKTFMINLLDLFSTDRNLLDERGSLIIRQLCLHLNTDRIYKAFAEILEKEEDLEFASKMIEKLNMILITSPELADFRRRLKSLEIRLEGQSLFTTLYRSWCHNAVSVFALCLLSQAYEHASNLLYIFADLEITVPLLVQIDKLVQLIESPVFTYLRLQLLEPEKYPYLFKCLYGLLMLLPQSTAFLALRNRLNAVNSAGFLHIAPKPSMSNISSTRSKLGRDDIKWSELLSHFRSVQNKHEKARRQAHGSEYREPMSESSIQLEPAPVTTMNGTNSNRPPIRRKATGSEASVLQRPPSRALSPLNPRARVQGTFVSPFTGQPQTSPPAHLQAVQRQQKRTISVNRGPPK